MSILEKLAVVFMVIITIVWAYAVFIWKVHNKIIIEKLGGKK